jgi:hypothetical protein
MQANQYLYLANLTKEEFNVVIGLVQKYGIKGLLGTVLELAQYNYNKENSPRAEKARAERIARELSALIERMEGFEELSFPRGKPRLRKAAGVKASGNV